MLTALRILTLIVWSGVIIRMSPSVWAIIRGRPALSDPVRLAWFCIAWVQVLGTLRWFIAPDSDELWQAVYVLLIATGVYVLHVSHIYGRGPPIEPDKGP